MSKKIYDEINRELSGFSFATEERLEKLERLSGRKDKKMKLRSKIAAAGIAAAAVAGLTISAGAATGWDYGKLIESFFPKTTSEQASPETTQDNVRETAEKLDGLMQEIPPESVTNTFTNYDVRFNGMICDGSTLMASAEIRDKNGVPFLEEDLPRYSTFFEIEELSSSGLTWQEIGEDGALYAYAIFDSLELSEKTELTVSLSYLLCDYEGLKMPAELSDLDPQSVLDGGTISARAEVEICETVRELTLSDGNGNTVLARVTPITLEYVFRPGQFEEQTTYLLKNGVFYAEDGEVLFDGSDWQLGTGDETGAAREDGMGFHRMVFSRVIDVSRIAGARCGAYTFGEVPDGE